eukprot:5866770-Amphidinium_carterae.1
MGASVKVPTGILRLPLLIDVVVVVVPNSPPREGAAVPPRPQIWAERPGVGGAVVARVRSS